MKRAKRNTRKGFTLIEVSLAIVIGVIIMAGGITLYNQTKVNAGNSKAQEKVQALAALIEESAAMQNRYPTITNLNTQWAIRRDDYLASPWGGTLTTAINGWAAGYASDSFPMTVNTGLAGGMMYSAWAGPAFVYDYVTSASKSWNAYAIGIVNSAGNGPCFVCGGK